MNNLKKISLYSSLIILSFVAGIYFVAPEKLGFENTKTETNANPAIATINGIEIKKSELIPYLRDVASLEAMQQWRTLDAIPPKIYETALINLAQDKLVRIEADKANITSSPEMKALMQKSANRIAKVSYINQLAPKLVNEESIKKRYDELSASIEGKKEFRARHILLSDKNEAKTIIKALKTRPFEELAKLFSLDDKTGLRGGDLGYVLPGTLNPEFEKQVTQLKIGKTSQPFKTQFGWHIAKLEDLRLAKPMPYEQAKPILRRQLEQQAAQDYLDNLVSKSEIKNFIAPKSPTQE
ncbi:MAG: peptidylprolyl isomerase [Gammaproteobacteria bacterium]|nr:peptidylprolyl isomerase [Gammaproteobacteria bacterium]